MENSLVEYIRSVSDFPQERVKAALLEQGWSLEQIDAAILQVRHEQSIARSSASQTAQVAVMALSFIIVSAFLFTVPGIEVTGKAVYSSASQIRSVRVSEEITRPRVQQEISVAAPKAPRCASLSFSKRDQCFAQEALGKKDVRTCNSISETSRQTNCVALVAVQNKDSRLCASAKSRDNCALTVARLSGDKKACDQIMNAPLRKNCISRKA